MERFLELIKNNELTKEQRLLPRFPFCYLTFKSDDKHKDIVFEVRDISYTGMQLVLKEGQHDFEEKEKIKGHIHWLGQDIEIRGHVKWIEKDCLGVYFGDEAGIVKRMKEFLSLKNMVSQVRPLHKPGLGLELPPTLKYWLRSDGPFELFVWTHQDGEYSKFQFLILDHFIEWVDGNGLQTGKVLPKGDIVTPLFDEDEFIFEIDADVDKKKLGLSYEFIQNMPNNMIPQHTYEFIKRKIG